MLQVPSDPTPESPRIALVTGGLKLGGSTTFLCNFAGELVRRKIPTEVLSFEAENPLDSDFRRSKIPVVCQNERQTIFEDRLLAILGELRRFEPTVVIATLSAMSFEVLRYLPPGIFRIGMVQSDDPGVYKMVGFYSRQLDLMAAVSQTIKGKLERMPEFVQVPAAYLPYGVEIPGKTGGKEKPVGPLRILYLGRLIREQKRVHLFPTILTSLKKSGIPFHWTIAGDGPDREWLRQKMTPGGSNQTVSFTGQVSYSQVPELLAAHDIFLLISDYEGLPLALLEAMGWGLVPVVSDLQSGISEVVNEANGKRVAVAHVEGYAEAINWLHEHRENLRQLSENARERVKSDYSVDAMTDRWLSILPNEVVKSAWPKQWRPKAPLAQHAKFRFTIPARVLRRYLLRFRS